jgi:hypothetical protein
MQPTVRPLDWGDRVVLNQGAPGTNSARWIVDLAVPGPRLRTLLKSLEEKWGLTLTLAAPDTTPDPAAPATKAGSQAKRPRQPRVAVGTNPR